MRLLRTWLDSNFRQQGPYRSFETMKVVAVEVAGQGQLKSEVQASTRTLPTKLSATHASEGPMCDIYI